MHAHLDHLNLKVLETAYLHEIEILKHKISKRASPVEVEKQITKAMELAFKIHNSQASSANVVSELECSTVKIPA